MAGDAPVIILSSGWSYALEKPPKITEAQAMKQYAIRFGATENSILLEEYSRDTAGNAYFTKIKILKPNSWHKVIVVTSDYHEARSEYLFRKILGPAYMITMVSTPSEPEMRGPRDSHEAKSFALAKEWLDPIQDGADEAVWNIMSTKHPAYSKNPEISKEELKKKLSSGKYALDTD